MLTHMTFGWRSQFLPHERLNQAAYNRAASLRVSDKTESERQKSGGSKRKKEGLRSCSVFYSLTLGVITYHLP